MSVGVEPECLCRTLSKAQISPALSTGFCVFSSVRAKQSGSRACIAAWAELMWVGLMRAARVQLADRQMQPEPSNARDLLPNTLLVGRTRATKNVLGLPGAYSLYWLCEH